MGFIPRFSFRNQTPSLPDAAPRSHRPRCGGRESKFLAAINPFFRWDHNGVPAGNGWNSPVNNAQWGTDYLNRTATAKSNMYDNRPSETKYIYRDLDSDGRQLEGKYTTP